MKMVNYFFALGAVVLTGCSFNPVGESTFECNRKEKPSEYCRSFKALEKSTNGSLPESRFDKEFKMSEYDRAAGIAPSGANEKREQVTAPAGTVLLPHNSAFTGDTLAGAPVRQAPVVQRAWIKQFTDENDALHGEVIVYKEIKKSKWSGFDATEGGGSVQASYYPHKTQQPQSVPDAERHGSPGQNFSQPESNFEDSVGTATSPAASGDN